MRYIPFTKAIIWQILRGNWKTVRDGMYFSIIHFEIAYILSIGIIKISDLWMTLNGLMTAVERHLYGSWCFMWPSQFGRKLVLGTRRRWPRPKRDTGTSRDRLCLLFGCTVLLSVLVLNTVHFSSTYAVTAGFAVFANDSCTRSILWLTQSIIDVARILSGSALFFPQKVDLFTVVALKTHAKTA